MKDDFPLPFNYDDTSNTKCLFYQVKQVFNTLYRCKTKKNVPPTIAVPLLDIGQHKLVLIWSHNKHDKEQDSDFHSQATSSMPHHLVSLNTLQDIMESRFTQN
ncbi:hypothetical protein CHARACLAT_024789 [Characodon lateralis]|uniref:Uncharacterized protein n=1 Tax=Characodon lateralis TaxID=208331 RepID=A0ABU7DX36_9TELE|nr:hypothetical protein [Characodon lateralis]